MESRTPPHNLEAEQSVLGSILLDNEVFANLEGTLHAEQFYKEAHRKVFRAMEKLHRRGEPLDLVTLAEELRVAGDLEGVGSVAYLVGLVDMVPTAAYAESYARIVQEKATLRDLIGAGGRIMQTAYDQSGPLEEVLDQAEKAIFDLTTRKRRTNFEGMRTLVTETFQDINERFANPNPVSGLRAGFRDLDGLTGGLQPASLNVLAARPSMGKTAFALTIGLNAALKEAASVGIFSLEMSAVQLVTRMLCAEARVDMSRVRSGQLSDRDFQRLADTAGRMSEARVFIDDHADMTVMELRSRARRLQAEHGLDLLIIDYLQLMSGSSRSQSENRQQEISAISRGLKGLARELDVPVLVLSQLSRAVEARPNKRPMLSDLRECVGGDTLVDLADGRRMPIADLVGLQPELFAVDARGKVVTAKSDKVWPVGEKELFEVRLASGRVRRTTARHLWYSFDGWKRLERLGPGDRVRDRAAPAGGRAVGNHGRRGVKLTLRTCTGTRSSACAQRRYAPFLVTAVPGPASLNSADGVVMHNSGAIEQDADLVMFIYRDEYYDPHSEKHGIAEIIIGKQRNGPTGSLELQFHNAHVRFNDLAKGGHG
ncbi:MAG: replicative DNA helicase [Trueperaceae bacterium]|nr:replicative DNA helicase [Trueperaceae bacterium]